MRRAGLAATGLPAKKTRIWHSRGSAANRLEIIGLSGASGERTAYDALVSRLAATPVSSDEQRPGSVASGL